MPSSRRATPRSRRCRRARWSAPRACAGWRSCARLRPDLRVEPLRGNLDTRLRKLDEGEYDAIVLAAAGLKRLGLAARIRARFDAARMLPAAGQGALGIEIRADATELGGALATLTHRPTWLAVQAERAVSRGARRQLQHAARRPCRLARGAARGSALPSAIPTGSISRCCARKAAATRSTPPAPRRSAARGAGAARPGRGGLPRRRRVGEPSPAGSERGASAAPDRHPPRAGRALGRASCARGIDAVALPLIAIAPLLDPEPSQDAWLGWRGRGLVVFVSPNAVERFFAARPAGVGLAAAAARGRPRARHRRRACARRRAGGGDRRAARPTRRSSTPRRCGSSCAARLARPQRAGRARRRRPRLAGREAAPRPAPGSTGRRLPAARAAALGRGTASRDAAIAAPARHAVAVQQLRGDRPPRGRSRRSIAARIARAGHRIRASPRGRGRPASARSSRRSPSLDAVVACIQSMQP